MQFNSFTIISVNSFKLLECKCACKLWEAASVVSTCLTDLLKRHQGGNKGWQRQTGHPYLGCRINDFALPSLYPHSLFFFTLLHQPLFYLSAIWLLLFVFFPVFLPSTSSQPFPRTSATHYTTELIIERCLSVCLCDEREGCGDKVCTVLTCKLLPHVHRACPCCNIITTKQNPMQNKRNTNTSAHIDMYRFLSFVFCCRIICTQSNI